MSPRRGSTRNGKVFALSVFVALTCASEGSGCRAGRIAADQPAPPAPPPAPVQPAVVDAAREVPPPAPVVEVASPGSRYPKIDVHMHIGPDGIPRAVALMNKWGIAGGVNLSGMYPGPPRHGLETQLQAAASTNGRLVCSRTPTSVAWCATWTTASST